MNGKETPQSLDEDDYKVSTIKLNVGGEHFETFKDTLTMNSKFFKAKFRGAFQEDEREIFLDRNGELFGHLLEYMRTKTLPNDRELQKRLVTECEYFMMFEMLKRLREELKKQRVLYSTTMNMEEGKGKRLSNDFNTLRIELIYVPVIEYHASHSPSIIKKPMWSILAERYETPE